MIKLATLNSFHPIPTYATNGSAAIDLSARLEEEAITLQPDQVVLIATGLKIEECPNNVAAIIYPRSGQGHKRGLILGNGTGLIDSDYRGQIMVSLWNRSPEPQTIQDGERIAQLMFVPIVRVEQCEPDVAPDRGSGGFGSTGA